MADLHPSEDQAVLYLQDRLSANERREFEARLAESAELRALLREFEDGSVALAMAVPRRKPPEQLWKRIEKVIIKEQSREAAVNSFWQKWWRFGWATAAVLLAGWLFHVLWLNRSPDSSTTGTQLANTQPEPASSNPRSALVAPEEKPAPPVKGDSAPVAAEVFGLRRQVADLSNHITQLSQSVAQQQALLQETNRLKFFQLTAVPGGEQATNAPVSAGLQRALFLAMARELGWQPPASGPDQSPTGNPPLAQRDPRPATTTNIAGVDFVDLRSGSNSAANPPPQPETQPGNAPDPNLQAATSASSVPGFVAGTNAVLAFDSSVVAAGATLRFWSGISGQWYQLIGSSVLGQNPMVVTIPFSSANGATLTVTAGNGFGSSNVLGQFPPAPGGP